MRAVVIGNGDIKNYEYIKSRIKDSDFIICADGGIRHIKPLGVSADVAIGDFDSAKKPDDIKTYRYPTDKDFTDGELALDYAEKNGYGEILMIGMTGTRLDHTITNILLMTKYDKICLVDDHNEIYVVKDRLTISDRKGKTLSVIPIFQNLEGVTTSGLLYPLNSESLCFASGRGNSNVITEDECTISVKSGMGIVLINNGE